jgi:Reverse transcriptase (RNA-dependent DNA polymerase)
MLSAYKIIGQSPTYPFCPRFLEQLLTHLKHHCLFAKFQSAYRKCFSTETALIKGTNDLLCASYSDQVSILAMLDLYAAFDKLDHDIQIDRLSTTFSCLGCVCSWLRSYIIGRTQRVIIDGYTISARSTLKFRVPQGSVLGQVLFTLYTHTLGNVISHYNISHHFYVDDSQLYDSAVLAEVPGIETNLSIAIASVCSWMTQNKLKMNEGKIEVILIRMQSKIAKVMSLGPEIPNPLCRKCKKPGRLIHGFISMPTLNTSPGAFIFSCIGLVKSKSICHLTLQRRLPLPIYFCALTTSTRY